MGAIAALYVSRVFVEFAPLDWPAPLVWLAGLVLALIGFAAILVIDASGCKITPVAVLIFYLLSPTINPCLAAITASVTVMGVLILAIDHPAFDSLPQTVPDIAAQLSATLASDAGVFLISLAVYTATLAPDLLSADSGEFQLVAPTLGIAHPPGYALYTLVGKVFTLIPVSTPAYRLNLMSAVLAATTLMLVNRTTRQLTASSVAGLVATVALASATTFWAQATTANIRMPAAFFTALLVWLLVRYGETRSDRDLILAAFAFGLGVTHHGSLAFIGLPAVLYVLWTQPSVFTNGRLLACCTAAFASTWLVLLYFPMRGATDAPLNPGGLTTLSGFLNHVLARGFRGDILAFTGRQILLDRLRVLLNILTIQFGRPLLILATIALIPLPHRLIISNLQSPISNPQSPISNLQSPYSTRHWSLLAGTFALIAGLAITYRAPQTVEYLMPAYVTLAILMGVGAAGLALFLSSPTLQAVTLSGALVLGLINIWQIAPSFRELSRPPDTRQVVEPILRDAPANATLLSNWHWATAFWYLQTVEGLRPDVNVQYIAPAGAESYPQTWRRRLIEALNEGPPVLLTNYYRTYDKLPARLTPFHDAFLATTAPLRVPTEASRVDISFENTIKLLGYALSATWLKPGEGLTVRLWWQPQVDAQHDYSVFVHLVDTQGRPVGQADVRYPAGRLTQGALIEDAYTIAVLPTVPPGEYTVMAGFYFTPPDGGFQRLTTDSADAVRLGRITFTPRRNQPVTQHRLEVPWTNGPALVGVDYDTSWPESTRVYLHWRMPEANEPWTVILTADHQPTAQTQVATAPAGSFLTTALEVPPNTNQLRLEVVDSAGNKLRAQGAWGLPVLGASIELPAIEPGDRYLVFGGEMALVDANWVPAEQEVTVDLRWVSLKPLVRDYTMSVQLLGPSGWRAQHDGTPALGAIPTLKWIRGTQVVDRHRIKLLESANGPADIQISVYDAFTQTPLGVLDDRFQRAGQGQGAVVGQVND